MKSNVPQVSIIIRTKNEEQWIAHCLKMVFSQTINDIEVVIVDNMSTDNTLLIARKFPVKIIQIEKYLPGMALNDGIRAATGEHIVCLSSHCIPKHEKWLEYFLRNFESKDRNIAGVYGRQIPFKYSSYSDKRDLLITFGLDKRIQEKDTFFHNANSMIPRSIWNKIPFNNDITNIEDRAWGREVIRAGYKIIYEPEAIVFHCHGIHHNNEKKRCEQTVKIMEKIHVDFKSDIPDGLKPENLNIVAFVPLTGDIKTINNTNLLIRAIQQLKDCSYVKDIVVISEKEDVLSFALQQNVKAIKRDASLLEKGKSVEDTLAYALEKYENNHGITDAVLFVNYLFPFRPNGFYTDLIEQYVYTGPDSVFAALKDYRVYWVYNENSYHAISKNFAPRAEKKPIYQSLVGLGCVTSSRFIRKASLLGDNVELLDIKEQKYALTASDKFSEDIAEFLFNKEELR